MTEPTARPGPDALAPARGGLLSPFLRRDLADLNALYLDLGLSSVADGDPRFAWSTAVRQCLLAADACTLARVAAVPFALFELVLPTDACAAPAGRVEDSRSSARSEPWPGCCESFAHQAAFLARRLVDAEPLASRVLLGLSADAQAWLAECRLSQLAELAVNPHMIRPRWRLHERYWEMLIGAARRASPAALQWAHCVGLCLIGTDGEGTVPQPPRRRARR
jgi:hypothetical protein